MPVLSVYEFSIPSPQDSSFTNGEFALSVATPINSAAGRTVHYLSCWFDLRGGIYSFKSVALDGALWSVSRTKNNGRVFHAARSSDVSTVEIYLPAGRHRIDVLLSNISTGASSCWIAFSLVQDGRLVYASNSDGWVFDQVPIEDADVPDLDDYRLTLPVFSVLPNWAQPVIERIDNKTEILSSESDAEQRRSIRTHPRRSFEASFARHDVRRARLENFFIGTGMREMLLPLWHEQFRIPATLGTELDFPAGTLAMREFAVGDLVWVNDGDPTSGEILRVFAITGDTIEFSAAPVGSWPAGSRVFPLRVARVLEAEKMDNLTDTVATVQARFSLKDTQQWPTPDWAPDATPLFSFPVNRADAISLEHSRPGSFMLDNDFGQVDITDVFERSRVSLRASLTLRGRSNVFAFRSFIAKARGRTVRFWMPSLTGDAFPQGNFSGPYVDVVKCGLSTYLQRVQDIRGMLTVIFKDGTAPIYRTVTQIADQGSSDRIFVGTNFPSISAANVRRIMFVLPARFDQDGFELQHVVDDSAVVRTSVIIRSAEMSDMPAIE